MLGETWEDQYRRLQRSHALLQRVADQNDYHPDIQQPEVARDILYHFCSDALNLRDWIKNSPKLRPTALSSVNQLFNPAEYPTVGSVALAACKDIANGSKHLQLTYTPTAEITGQSQGATLPAELPFYFAANHWDIDIGGVEHDAHDLATQAVADWDAWLMRHGIPLPT